MLKKKHVLLFFKHLHIIQGFILKKWSSKNSFFNCFISNRANSIHLFVSGQPANQNRL